MSLSDSASNGTGTPPPPPQSSSSSHHQSTVKTVKTGKIYKPKFHTALHCATTTTANNEPEISLSNGVAIKPNAVELQEHIDRIITDNQAIVEAVDPRLYKLMQRQASLVESSRGGDQPLNLSNVDEVVVPEKRRKCNSDDIDEAKTADIISCVTCKITFASNDSMETHRR